MKITTILIHIFNKLLKYISPLNILSTEESINYLIKEKCSLSRFGDGELIIINGGGIHFQTFNKELQTKLIDILRQEDEVQFKVGIPLAINYTKNLTHKSYEFWEQNMSTGRMHWFKLCNSRKTYLNASLTWCFSDYKDKKKAALYLEKILSLWNNQKVLLIEGKTSKLGINNSLFANTRYVKRIICPNKNAYEYYDFIKQSIKNHYNNELVILSLGPTASVLAYDLHKEGIRAIDIGHFNFQYNDYLNQLGNNKNCPIITDDIYKEQIIQYIGI